MSNSIKLIAGGVAGLLVPVAAAIALFAYSLDDSPTSREDARAQGGDGPLAEPREVAPVPAPRLDTALATTRRAAHTPEAQRPEAAPRPSPRREPVLSADGPLRVRRLVVATGVRAHEPTGAGDTFALGETPRIYAFVEASSSAGEDARLDVTFEPRVGESTGHVSLEIPAGTPRWRTWAFTRHVYRAGEWEAVVRAADGRVLARRAFTVVE